MDRIKDILAGMQFERRRPVTQHCRTVYAAMQKEVGAALKTLNRLHLRLWHAQQRRDYHVLSLKEARDTLKEVCSRLDMLCADE